jgi:hypothetical protein
MCDCVGFFCTRVGKRKVDVSVVADEATSLALVAASASYVCALGSGYRVMQMLADPVPCRSFHTSRKQ